MYACILLPDSTSCWNVLGIRKKYPYEIIAKNVHWPSDQKERDLLYFLAQSFQAKLLYESPKAKQEMTVEKLSFVFREKAMLKELSTINFEIAQMTVASDEGKALPDRLMVEIVRDLPRLVQQK